MKYQFDPMFTIDGEDNSKTVMIGANLDTIGLMNSYALGEYEK